MESSSRESTRSQAAVAFFPLLVFRHFAPAMTLSYHAGLFSREKLLIVFPFLNPLPFLRSEVVGFDNMPPFGRVTVHL